MHDMTILFTFNHTTWDLVMNRRVPGTVLIQFATCLMTLSNGFKVTNLHPSDEHNLLILKVYCQFLLWANRFGGSMFASETGMVSEEKQLGTLNQASISMVFHPPFIIYPLINPTIYASIVISWKNPPLERSRCVSILRADPRTDFRSYFSSPLCQLVLC